MVATAWQERRMCDGGHVYVLGTVPLSKCVCSQSMLNKELESPLCGFIKFMTQDAVYRFLS